jgi:hypothetical protein
MEQGEQARLDLNAIVQCIVERAGKSLGDYQISADLTTLKWTPPAKAAAPATP